MRAAPALQLNFLQHIYTILKQHKLDGVCRVTICTIQRLYAMLRGEELNEDLDEKSGFEIAAALAPPPQHRHPP